MARAPTPVEDVADEEGLFPLFFGEIADVRIRRQVVKDYKKWEKHYPNQFYALEEKIKAFCDLGEAALVDHRDFIQEDRITEGHRKITVYAFKAFKIRAYGVKRKVNGKPEFVITVVATKKQDDADPNDIKGAARHGSKLNGA